MKFFVGMLSCMLLLMCLTGSAYAMTGSLVNGEPPVAEVIFTNLDAISSSHDETVDNPQGWYKGWWWVNLTNNTGTAWSSVTITPGVGDNVALVEGNGLVDEWGFIGNSIVSNKAGTITYSGVRGDGSRLYENGATGLLWAQARVDFTTALAVGQKVGFKIYTDNSWYTGPYASSFSIVLTPNVPEPASLLALSSGLIGLAGFALRRRR